MTAQFLPRRSPLARWRAHLPVKAQQRSSSVTRRPNSWTNCRTRKRRDSSTHWHISRPLTCTWIGSWLPTSTRDARWKSAAQAARAICFPTLSACSGERSGSRADPWRRRSYLMAPWRRRVWQTTRRAWPGISSITATLPSSPDISRSRLHRPEESFDLTGDMEPGILPALAGAVLASALLEAGQVGRSVEVLVSQAGGAELPLIGGGWRARFLELLTRSLLAAGQPRPSPTPAQMGRPRPPRRRANAVQWWIAPPALHSGRRQPPEGCRAETRKPEHPLR